MQFVKLLLLPTIIIFFFNACTIFKKEIKRSVTVSISDTLFLASFKTTSNYIKYTNLHSANEINSAFIKGFMSEAKMTKNVIVKINDASADYSLNLKKLEIIESSKLETINDSKSPYNGQQIELNSIECNADIAVVNNKNITKDLMDCSNSKSRSEKIKNNRDIGDLISGSNKDHTHYRTKLLSDNICVSLAEDVGRRIWVPITRRIAKNIKIN